MKVRKCSFMGCEETRMKRPGNNSFYFKFCAEHQIDSVLKNLKKERLKDKIELEMMRKNKGKSAVSKKTNALKLADLWFSRFIRFKYAFEQNGIFYVKCYTCENEYPILSMDNGHWQKRQHMATRFNENNARPQCTSCNYHNKGEYTKFEINLIDEIGFEEAEKIKQLATTTFNVSTEYFRDIASTYRIKCNNLFKEKGLKNIWI